MFKLRVKIGECEFEAKGELGAVIQQFGEFQRLVEHWQPIPLEWSGLPPSAKNPPGSPSLETPMMPAPSFDSIFETDPHSPTLICRMPPPGKDSEAKLALLLLLGYLKIRGITELSVLTLKQAVKYSLHPVARLDRLLQHYLRDRFVIKIGRGKGGKYRLTPLGINKALTIAQELTSEWQPG